MENIIYFINNIKQLLINRFYKFFLKIFPADADDLIKEFLGCSQTTQDGGIEQQKNCGGLLDAFHSEAEMNLK